MKLLILSQYFWPENFRINDVVEGLTERGHAVTVYTGIPNYPSGRYFSGYGFLGPLRERYKAAEVRRAPLIARGGGSGVRLALNFLSHAFFATLLAPWLARGRFDAILVYEPSPMTIGIPARTLRALKRAPLLFWVQDLWPESLSATGAVKSRALLGVVDRLIKWIYRGCDRVLVQLRGEHARLITSEARPHPNPLPEGEGMASYVAGIDIAGEDEEAEDAALRSLRRLRREPIFAYTIPSKIQAYIACGKPVIAALEGEGARNIREAGAGWVVPPENPQALADAVIAASRLARSELSSMGERGEAWFREHFERDKLLSRLEAELREAAQ